MKRWKKILFSMLICLALANCAGNVASGDCEFVYTEQIRDLLVIPLIKKILGEEAYKFYNYETPTVLHEGKEVWLLMSPIKSIDGNTLMSEESFVVVLEKCTDKYIDYFTQKMN